MAQNHFININSYNSYLTSFNTTGITSNMSLSIHDKSLGMSKPPS